MGKKDSIPHLPGPVNKVYYQETWGSPNPFTGKRALIKAAVNYRSAVDVEN